MASNEFVPGPAMRNVIANVRRRREELRVSQAELSQRLSALGRPIRATGLHRLETGRRRVDADDLVALALALEVSPITLFMPWESSEGVVQLTEAVSAPTPIAWEWVRGIRPLELPDDQLDADYAEQSFQRRALPREARGQMQRAGRVFLPVDESPGEMVGGGGDRVEHRETP